MKKIDIACIIDDDPIFLYGAKRIMSLNEFCNGFLIFHNGKEAIDYLRPVIENDEKTPQVILLDINMPVMDGWEFLDEFVTIKTAKKIPIYVVSSSSNKTDMDKAKQYNLVTNYLIKPINADQLKQILEDVDGVEES